MKFILLTCILLLSMACATGTDALIDKEELNFNYTDDAYIFYRNMRQAKYDLITMEKEGLRVYQHDSFEPAQFFKSKMVVDWKRNKAFMLIDLPDSIPKQEIKVFRLSNQQKVELHQVNLRRQGELHFLTDIYNAIISGEPLELEYAGEVKPLFLTEDDQEAFRVSMYDFYRLTGLL